MSADLRQLIEQLLQQATAEVGTVAKRVRITFRTYLDPEPVVELAENEELLHIVLVPLERPAGRPMPDLGAQRTYGEEREPDLEVETPSKLEAIMEAMRDIEL